MLLGRCFGLGALLRSGRPLEPALLRSAFAQLLECGAKKSFLREASAVVALEAAARMDRACVAKLAAEGQPLAALLGGPAADATPEVRVLCCCTRRLWSVCVCACVGGGFRRVWCVLLPAGPSVA